MLQKLKITTYVFILFLFGFTLITVSPVFAEDSPEFGACQQGSLIAKKNCYRDLARLLVGDSTEFIACQQMKRDTGGTKEKKNCFRALARAGQAKREVNLCLASLKEIDERTFRNCNSAKESVDTMRGGGDVCVGGSMWHNRYEGGKIDEIRKCGESKELPNQKECSSALYDLALAIEAFNMSQLDGGEWPRRYKNRSRSENGERWNSITSQKDWWEVADVGKLNGSWRDARKSCGF
jgi:hypothetical protein